MTRTWTKPMQWQNKGTEPSEALKQSGFTGGYKPAAGTFNYFLNKEQACIEELQVVVDDVETNAAKTDLSNVDAETLKAAVENSGFHGGAANILDGSAIGSVRTVDSTTEDEGYTMGEYAFAEGYKTEARGNASHAEGYNTEARGNASHAEGRGTIAGSNLQHVQGKHNIEDSSGIYAHIVGNGTDRSNRSNAHTLDWTGNAWFAGIVTVGPSNKELAQADLSNVTAAQALTNLGAAPAYSYGTEDLEAGVSALETGKLYFVYE